jgi:hypothetical protein
LLATADCPADRVLLSRQGFAKAMMNGIALNSLLHSVDSEFHPNGLPTDFSARYFKNSASTMQALW